MKKLLLCIAIIITVTGFALCANAETSSDGLYKYRLKDGNAVLTKYLGADTELLQLPAKIDGHPVIAVGRYFNASYGRKITCVEIPEGYRSIGSGAFCNPSLTSVKLPSTLEEIGEKAFSGTSLSAVSLPESLKTIGDGAFSSCPITSIAFPGKLESIGLCAFENTLISTVTLPSGLKGWSGNPFAGCRNLTEILVPKELAALFSFEEGVLIELQTRKLLVYPTGRKDTEYRFPRNVTGMGAAAFQGSSLTQVVLPDSIEAIPKNAFRSSMLTSITVPNSVTKIGNLAFDGCASLREVQLPSSLRYISDGIFNSCSSLQSIELPGGLTSIGSTAFEKCTSLKNVRIPNSVTYLGYAAFRGCSSLISIDLPEGLRKIPIDCMRGCTSLTEVRIPSAVTTVESNAFRGCAALSSVVVPKSVTSIEESSFASCPNLSLVVEPSSVAEQFAQIMQLPYTYAGGATTPPSETPRPPVSESAFVFRGGITWDSTPDDIRKAEHVWNLHDQTNGGIVRYTVGNVTVSNFTADLLFFYKSNRLAAITYGIKTEKDQLQNGYQYLVDAMTHKYGVPAATDAERLKASILAIEPDYSAIEKTLKAASWTEWALPDQTLVVVLSTGTDLGILYFNQSRLMGEEANVPNTDGL